MWKPSATSARGSFLRKTTDLLEAGGNQMLHYGHIALQAERQPGWFRKIELKSLEKK